MENATLVRREPWRINTGMDDHHSLLEEIVAFCRRAGIAQSTFGKQVVNDGKFVGRLYDGIAPNTPPSFRDDRK